MKKLLLVFGMAVLVLTACNKQNTPKAVADNFLKAWTSSDFEEAKKYGTEDSKKLLDMMNSFKSMVTDSSFNKEKEYKITKEKTEGDNATVYYKVAGNNVEEHLQLVKVNGEWKVNVSKESINGTEGNGTIDIGATNTDTTSADTISGGSN